MKKKTKKKAVKKGKSLHMALVIVNDQMGRPFIFHRWKIDPNVINSPDKKKADAKREVFGDQLIERAAEHAKMEIDEFKKLYNPGIAVVDVGGAPTW